MSLLVILVKKFTKFQNLTFPPGLLKKTSNNLIINKTYLNLARSYLHKNKNYCFGVYTVNFKNVRCFSFKQESKKQLNALVKFNKLMLKYWYVAIPVHISTTGLFAFGIYFYVTNSKNVDKLLRSFNIKDETIKKMRSSWLGNFAIVAVLMKLTAAIRLGLTFTLTSIGIKILENLGYLKKIDEKKAKLISNSKGRIKKKQHRYHHKKKGVRNQKRN